MPNAAAVIVARGPLVIMAHGLMALDPEDRGACFISSEAGNLLPHQVEEALRRWSKRH